MTLVFLGMLLMGAGLVVFCIAFVFWVSMLMEDV